QAQNVSLDRMQLNDFSNFAIHGVDVTGFSLSNTVVNGVNGNSTAFDEGSVSFDDLTGTAAFDGNTISGGLEDNISILNTTGTLSMSVNGGTIGLNSTLFGNDGILLETQGSAVVNLNVTGTTFLGARGDLIQANALGTSTLNVTIQDNTFQNAHTNSLGGGVTISGGSASSVINLTYDISGTAPGAQTFRDAVSNAITANIVNGAGTVTGRIQNNNIGVSGIPGSGSSAGSGIAVGAGGTVSHTVTIDDNSIVGVASSGAGIDVVANGDSTVNATITDNSATQFSGFPLAALNTISGGGSTDTASMCADIKNNTFSVNPALFPLGDIFTDQISSSASYRFPGYVGPAVGGPVLDSFLAGQNTLGANGAFTAAAQNVTGTGTSCP
ncbi:MAG: hypothetical protein V3W34_15510, partial [Phycisphaerae bacterium]